MKVDEFFKEWTGQRPNLCTAFHEAGIEAMAFAEAYHKQQVKLLATPAVSVAKHTLPRPLEAWENARNMELSEYIEWHLEQERRGNAR